MTPTGRNAILVVLDSARKDDFDRLASNFKELSARGVRFERAIAPAGWTLPSHVSMFSGLSPSEHGAMATGAGKINDRSNAMQRVRSLIERDQLLVPRLARAGVESFSASANPWVGPASGLDSGFTKKDHFGFLPVGRRRIPDASRSRNFRDRARAISLAMIRHAAWIRGGADKGSERVLDGIDNFLDETRKPFFIFTNLIETHEPHYAPRAVRRGPAWSRERILSAGNTILQPGAVRAVRIRNHNWGGRQLPEGLVMRWKRAYEDEIRYVDRWVTRLVELLDRKGLGDSTTIIVTSDHGEAFGEEGTIGHGLSLGRDTTHVPLAILDPELEPRTVEAPVSLRGIAGTLEGILLGDTDAPDLFDENQVAHYEAEAPTSISAPPKGVDTDMVHPAAVFYRENLELRAAPDGKRTLRRAGEEIPVAEASADLMEALRAWEARIETLRLSSPPPHPR